MLSLGVINHLLQVIISTIFLKFDEINIRTMEKRILNKHKQTNKCSSQFNKDQFAHTYA